MTEERDRLTGFYKEEVFTRKIEEELARTKRYGRSLMILCIEPLLPSQVRHDFLYPVMKRTGKLIRHLIRSIDIPGRVSDKLFIALPETNRDGAMRVAEKVIEGIREVDLEPMVEKKLSPLLLVVGIASYPGDGEESRDLIRHAEAALVRARELPGSSSHLVAFFSPSRVVDSTENRPR